MHILPLIGQMDLAALRPKHVRDMVRKLRAETKQEKGPDGKTVAVRALAPRTVRHVYGTLRCMLGDALVDDLVPINACALRRHDLPPDIDSDPAWREQAIFGRQEIVQLISDPRINAAHRVLYALLALAGPRVGGCVVRRWRDIDFDAKPLGKLAVISKWRKDVRAEVPGSKSKMAIYVPIHPTLARILRGWWLSGWACEMGAHPTPDDLIVPTRPTEKAPRGAMRTPGNVWLTLQRDLATLGLRARRAHDLRVSCVSLARADGARPDILKWVTHGPSKRSIVDIYTRLPWETLCAEVAKLRIELPECQVIALPVAANSGGQVAELGTPLGTDARRQNESPKIVRTDTELLEARIGFEPMNEGFADPSLSHLGTAPEPHPTWG